MTAVYLDVAEVARRIGLSKARIYQLIQAGELPAHKHAARWLVSSDDVPRVGGQRQPGRPWSPVMSWALLAQLAPDALIAPKLSPWQASRLRRSSEDREWMALADRLRRRAELHHFRVHPGLYDKLRFDPRVVMGGTASSLVDIRGGGEIEAYVKAEDLPGLRHDYAFGLSERPNVLIHSVVGHWPFRSRQAPAIVGALDLLESREPRSVRAAKALLAESG